MVTVKRLKGFVLLESVFAMIAVMICFGIAVMIFNQVTTSASVEIETLARLRLQQEADQLHGSETYVDGQTTCEGFVIRRTFVTDPAQPHLTEMILIAVNDNQKILAEYHEFLLR